MTQSSVYNQQNNVPQFNNKQQNNGQYGQPVNYPSDQLNQQNVTNNWPVPNQSNGPYTTPMSVNIPQQQQTTISPSPEVPARIESQENIAIPERTVEGEKNIENVEKTSYKKEKKDTITKEPDHEPEQKKFESPFRVYGYKAPADIAQLGDSLTNGKVKGNPQDAKTWIFVLLGKLLRIYRGEAFKT